MKFSVKLCLQDANVATTLIRNLFKDINPESSIYIKGNSAVMDIVFDKEPNSELMEAISECELKELKFNYTEDSEKTSIDSAPSEASNIEEIPNEEGAAEKVGENEKIVEAEEPAEKTDAEDVEEATIVEVVGVTEEMASNGKAKDIPEFVDVEEMDLKDVKSDEKNAETNAEESIDTEKAGNVKKRKYNCSKGKDDDIPALQELANQAQSFNEFIGEVCNWLNLGKDKAEYFTKLVNKLLEEANPEMKITTKGIENITLSLGYTKGMKTVLGKYITKKLIEINSPGTLMPFLKNVIKFRNSFTIMVETNEFQNSRKAEKSSYEANNSDEEDAIKRNAECLEIGSIQNNEETTQECSKTEGMKRIPGFPSIPKFEEFLSNLDFSNSVRGIVIDILNAMGADELDKNLKNKMINVCVFAVLMKPNEVDYKECFKKANIFYDSAEGNELRMEIAKFVNSFISFAYSGRYSSITTQVFLKGISEFIKSHEQAND